MSGKMRVISDGMAEAGELLEHAIGVVFLGAALVILTCAAILVAAGTFAVLHPSNDFNFGGGSGRSGDIIVVPAQLF